MKWIKQKIENWMYWFVYNELLEPEFYNSVILKANGEIKEQLKMKGIPPVGSKIKYSRFVNNQWVEYKFVVEDLTISEHGCVIWVDGEYV